MIINEHSKYRPFHLGLFPFEAMKKKPAIGQEEIRRESLRESSRKADNDSVLANAAGHYSDLFMQYREGEVVATRAPVPDDLQRRSVDIKGCIYFLNGSHAGICRMPENAWVKAKKIEGHHFAIVIVVEKGRVPEADNLAYEWLRDSIYETTMTRATSIAVNVANYCGQLGYKATAHAGEITNVDIKRLAVMAGVCCRSQDGVVSPFLHDNVVITAVTTEYELATDLPLLPVTHANKGLRYWWGINGAESGRERNRKAKRASHMSAYPMEQVKRVDRPTTLILDDEVPRVPHRASFFERPKFGDLGPKAKFERTRFAYKNPSAMAYVSMIRSMLPHQDNEVVEADTSRYNDPAANSKAIKSLGYSLGVDLIGICEIPRYAWYSHHDEGVPIKPYHKYAVVMLIDQGFDTMEGASGDDWISGSQSMRAYMRGGEIAGVMARFLCNIGFPARPQTNLDTHVLHIPLILWAGLGELSRIGELVLNPFVGPRFKSVVMTTDMPLEVDKPIDFGLQYFCNNCLKCARECPCDAIPVTDKVMFNGYEMWKIDAERCARYRLANQKGAGCGRCMKTCPLNKVPTADGSLIHRIGSWLGVNAMWVKPLLVPIAVWLDDVLGHGKINPLKKWWLDLEVVNGISVTPKAGTNKRGINPKRKMHSKEKIAYYHANLMPPPDQGDRLFPLDRKAVKESAKLIETPDQARVRIATGGAKPLHYIPTPPLKKENAGID